MKNLYKNTMEEIKLDDAAKERIYNGVVNKLKEEKPKKQHTPFSLKAFRLATACASAAIVCGTAIGTGIYFGTKGDNGKYGNNEDGTIFYNCYYIGYEMEKDEYDIDNVEINLYYAFDEAAIRGRYNQVLEEAERKSYGEVLKYEIILRARNNNYDKYGNDDKFVLDRLEIKDIDAFPFDDYRINIIEENGEVIERTYMHSEKIVLPNELFFEQSDDYNTYVQIYLHERIEYEIGYKDFVPKYNEDGSIRKDYWSEYGRVANDWGYPYGFYPIDNCLAMFYFKLNGSKVIIDNSPIAKYMVNGEIVSTQIDTHIKVNMKPIYNFGV